MFGSGRPDGTTARARLRSITPRWVPAEADLDEARRSTESPEARIPARSPAHESGGWDATAVPPGRHSLPDRPRPSWRLDAGAARGLVSLALAALVGALIVVVAGWPRGEVAPSAEAASSGKRAPSQNVLVDPSPSASSSPQVVVDVDGAIRRPGVVELAGGSRVIDAIKAAGGVRPGADTGALNLAQVLIDGEQVVVPNEGDELVPGTTAPGASPAPGSVPSTGLVNLNTATEVELDTLPGIGPVLAAAIIEWRTQNSGFTSVEQLQDVSGIGPTTFADLAPLVRV